MAPSPHLNALAQAGLVADALQPVFPSKTFPNHYSLVTGLHPENHGVIDNGMYDPEFDARFTMSNSEEVGNSRWWGGEPIWVTAEQQGQIAATYFFPGSEAPIKGVRPSYWFPYDGKVPNRQRVDTVLQWLQLPEPERPRIISMYFSDVDAAGHAYGPESHQVRQALKSIDNEIGYLVAQLQQLGLFDHIDLLISSDHGMATVNQAQHIVIDQAFDPELAEYVRYSREIVSIFPKLGQEDIIYQQLKAALPDEGVRLYRKSELPDRFHYRQHRRIAPIQVLAEVNWILVRRSWLPGMINAPTYREPRGSHGYDNQEPSMQGMLIAHGPSFKTHTRIEQVRMVDLYQVMTEILGLTPAPHDGDPAMLLLLLNNKYNIKQQIRK
ncbi:ectonucleotide pyrophosphatase/phosphodiesterase [Alkalimonas collagenimarina]|uniref:Ectonucleotide pyrophosphatase/phosphodiesterase n=1 Tax=Alkalimonas collagenimarina TaxID=400390 RepID=A0ABT9GW15_9GAMM|nr:ectonucleotide pyrophosphatase/phosphodiesterase [Alkalimonas collagenimarina]MDP4535213.1 ectonucleotide pyrophosphatase/phosphodiesterase [Alkalimonas collagenimarina]